MEKKKRLTAFEKSFAQGFLCCLCVFIDYEGGVNTQIEEAWSAGGYNFDELRRYGIDDHDISKLRKYRKELQRKTN